MSKQLSSKKQIKKIRKAIQKSANPQPELQIPEFKEPIKGQVTFVLEGAVLEVGYLKSGKVLLNFEDHSQFITKRLRRNPEEFRPDIIHQSLLAIMDSPLNKAGCVRVLIHTEDERLIEINPETKIPRTFKRFSGMLVKLLETGAINAEEVNLLQIHSVTIQDFLGEGNEIISTSHKGNQVNLQEYLQGKQKVVLVVGAVAKGNPGLSCSYSKECISVSRYQLSTSNCLSKLLDCFEQIYNIL